CVLELGAADLVLGPAEDGGYYLLGLRQPARGIFQGIAWSTAHVFEQVLANGYAHGLRAAVLPRWYDVDTPQDLRPLHAELRADPAAGRRAPATWRWLRTHPSP